MAWTCYFAFKFVEITKFVKFKNWFRQHAKRTGQAIRRLTSAKTRNGKLFPIYWIHTRYLLEEERYTLVPTTLMIYMSCLMWTLTVWVSSLEVIDSSNKCCGITGESTLPQCLCKVFVNSNYYLPTLQQQIDKAYRSWRLHPLLSTLFLISVIKIAVKFLFKEFQFNISYYGTANTK